MWVHEEEFKSWEEVWGQIYSRPFPCIKSPNFQIIGEDHQQHDTHHHHHHEDYHHVDPPELHCPGQEAIAPSLSGSASDSLKDISDPWWKCEIVLVKFTWSRLPASFTIMISIKITRVCIFWWMGDAGFTTIHHLFETKSILDNTIILAIIAFVTLAQNHYSCSN